ncbi:MAG: hypothetical protein JRJ62_15615 [Deltaproteobacteria bacterium]|nr:hypothetical protein [Deltaproteobacteria bacterium]
MSNSINLGMMPKSETELRTPKPDRTVDKPFCIQADDENGMFRFIACSKVDDSKGDE